MTEITRILSEIENGDPTAAEQLLPILYEELRRLAKAKLANENPGQTLQATALVHEAFLRLTNQASEPTWQGRAHFFGAAARAMQRILVENARRKRRIKAGGDLHRLRLSDVQPQTNEKDVDLLALEEALTELESTHPRKAEVVRLRYFAGMTLREAAEILQISISTADNDWSYAKNWLRVRISKE